MRERRILALLLGLVLSQLVLLATQVQRPSGSSVLDVVALRAVSPFAHLVARAFDLGGAVRGAFARRQSLEAENARLREENSALETRLAAIEGLAIDLEGLPDALAYRPLDGVPVAVADVSLKDQASWLRTLVIRVPRAARPGALRADLPVVSTAGVVGRLSAVSGPWARVLPITDRASSVAVMIERTRRQGIVRGDGEGTLVLDYLPLTSDVKVGDRVLTAGIDGVYPRGLLVGQITTVERGDDLFWRVEVAPSVDFAVLERVHVLFTDSVPEVLRGDELVIDAGENDPEASMSEHGASR